MKIKQLFERLIENWPVKAVCLVLAFFLYIFNQQAGMETKIIKTKVEVGSDSGFRPAEIFNSNVSVSLRGKKDAISQISESDVKAYLDFSYVAKGGEYDFPVLLTFGQSVTSINPLEIKVIPEKINVKVEEEIAGFAKIEPLLKGEAQHGYKVESIVLDPEQIKIRGARSLVENCKSLQTENIVLSNARTSFSGTAKIENLKKNITLESDKVSFTVKIAEIQDSKKIDNVQVKIENLRPELEIEKNPSAVSLSVSGSLLSLESFTDFSSVCRADCSGITGEGSFTVPLKYYLPTGIRLGENYAKSVSVKVSAKKSDEENQKNENDDMMEKIPNVIENGEIQ